MHTGRPNTLGGERAGVVGLEERAHNSRRRAIHWKRDAKSLGSRWKENAKLQFRSGIRTRTFGTEVWRAELPLPGACRAAKHTGGEQEGVVPPRQRSTTPGV